MRGLRLDFSSASPIWSQIDEGMRRLVASQILSAGTAVPSIRDLAGDLQVNPATVAKAYQRLADDGILIVRRGEGTYVADAAPAIRRAERSRMVRDAAARYAALATSLGVSADDAASELAAAWRRLGFAKGDRR